MIAARRNFRVLTLTLSLAALLGASGCSLWGGSPKPKPAELGPNVPVLGVRQAWYSRKVLSWSLSNTMDADFLRRSPGRGIGETW